MICAVGALPRRSLQALGALAYASSLLASLFMWLLPPTTVASTAFCCRLAPSTTSILKAEPDTAALPDHNVGLVLLGAGARLIGVDIVEQCRRRFPNAAIAIAIDNGLPVVDPILTEQRLIQGILPTTLPLDVWFALMRLVMAGGEYLPHGEGARSNHSAPVHRSAQGTLPLASANPALPNRQRQAVEIPVQQNERTSGGAENGLDTLTAREREILTLVSEGYQNKLIADRMALSEHTVKAHVHNLIAKLRVTNRTQAAAYLHEHRLDKNALNTGHGDHRRATALG